MANGRKKEEPTEPRKTIINNTEKTKQGTWNKEKKSKESLCHLSSVICHLSFVIYHLPFCHSVISVTLKKSLKLERQSKKNHDNFLILNSLAQNNNNSEHKLNISESRMAKNDRK